MSTKRDLRIAIAAACKALHALANVKDAAMCTRASYLETSNDALKAIPGAKTNAYEAVAALAAQIWSQRIDATVKVGDADLNWFVLRVTEASRGELEAWASAIADAEPVIIAALDDVIADTERPVAAEGVA